MHGFEELARLLAAPSIAAPKARRGREGASRERDKPPDKPPKKSDEQQESPNPDEYIEVGDPRDGP
jgi:hypothetical protein